MAGDVESFRDRLDVQMRDIVDAIRAIIAASHSGLTERIKWNAPSFAIGGDDRITLGLERAGGVRVVMHRGAKPKTLGGFSLMTRMAWPNGRHPTEALSCFRARTKLSSAPKRCVTYVLAGLRRPANVRFRPIADIGKREHVGLVSPLQ